ncbi:MAG: hypothetical protein ACJA2W_003528 [Planctomycetota bacterium]|jgi:hypothetical protein
MAKSKGRSGRGGAKPAPAAPKRREPVVDEIEVVEEEGGMGVDDGIILMTTLILLVAFLMVDYNRGKNYGEGMLFAGKYVTPTATAATPVD